MKHIYLILAAQFILSPTSADEKDPIAVDDYSQTFALKLVEIRALSNDYSYENHPVRIISVTGSGNGTYSFNDSLIFYTPERFFTGIDSLRYRIRDLTNGLYSNWAKVYIQVENKGIAFLDKNDVKCRINSCGLQFTDGKGNADYEIPKGSGLKSIDSKTLWIGGYDDINELHLAAEVFRFGEMNDFFPGPITDTSFIDISHDVQWNRVWKLSKQEIDYHRENWQQAGYEPIENIKDWPGNGNPQIGQSKNIAPFYDWDNDGNYNPMEGDFPIIKGDQSIFLVYNDNRTHTESGGKKLGVEIQAFYYVYDLPGDSALNQTVFGSLSIINRSDLNYHNLVTAFHVIYAIGFYYDDYLGCDTLLHSGYVYNSSPIDGDGGEGTYGINPPAQSFTLLNQKLNGLMSYNLASTVVPYMKHPDLPIDYYKYLNCTWLDNSHLSYDSLGWGGDRPVNYIFSGNPVLSEGWNESPAFSPEWYRIGLAITEPRTFNAGDTLVIDFALVFARGYDGNNLTSVGLLKSRIERVREFYVNSLGVNDLNSGAIYCDIYPNPFNDLIMVEHSTEIQKTEWKVLDLTGNIVSKGRFSNQTINQLDLGFLQKGFYLLMIDHRNGSFIHKIFKL